MFKAFVVGLAFAAPLLSSVAAPANAAGIHGLASESKVILANPTSSLYIYLKGGNRVTACLKNGEARPSICTTKPLPKPVVGVQKIIQGEFVHTNGASWLAISSKKSYLCGVSTRSPRIICMFVDTPVDGSNIEIRESGGSLYFDVKSGIKNHANLQAFSGAFALALREASALLQDALAKGFVPPSARIDSSPATFAEDEDDEERTPDQPEGDIGTPGGSSGGDGGEGSGDGEVQVVVIVAPRPAPTMPPLPVPEIPAIPSTTSMCDLFPSLCPAPIRNESLYDERVRQCEADYEADYDSWIVSREVVYEDGAEFGVEA